MLAAHLRARLGDLGFRLLNVRLRLCHLRQRLLMPDLEITRVQSGDHLAGLYHVVLLHQHLGYGARDARAYLVDVRRDVSVIRLHPRADVFQPAVSGPGGGGDHGGGQEAEGELFGA